MADLSGITLAMVMSLAPPVQYDYEPVVPYHISYTSQQRVEELCPSPGAFNLSLGCTLPRLGLIYVAKGLNPRVRDFIVRHEKAHINGWKH